MKTSKQRQRFIEELMKMGVPKGVITEAQKQANKLRRTPDILTREILSPLDQVALTVYGRSRYFTLVPENADPNDACWLWKGKFHTVKKTNKNGKTTTRRYPTMYINSQPIQAARLVWVCSTSEELPKSVSLLAMHNCTNKDQCVNPAHKYKSAARRQREYVSYKTVDVDGLTV
ncbi:hypothetical protein OsccyDRAFT_0637 [Leptolyngbyaceae cyanobacterium JSC-12]|nr:hypothetical protein OsccyDRAFT_0637 [Leptolyngbyaceae cyanobacterium JSC-12]